MVLLTSSQFIVPVSYTLLVREFPGVAAAVDTEFAGTKAVEEGLDEEEESSMAACASGALRVNQEGLLTLAKKFTDLSTHGKSKGTQCIRKFRAVIPPAAGRLVGLVTGITAAGLATVTTAFGNQVWSLTQSCVFTIMKIT